MDKNEIRRRQVLRSGAVAGIAGIAGCSGSSGADGGSFTESPSKGVTPGACSPPPEIEVRSSVLPVAWLRSALPSFGDRSSSDPVAAQESPPGAIPLEDVPLPVHRRAAQLIERVRGTDTAPGWENARLSGVAYPLFRPDLDGIAFYEFDVEPAGFVVLATDEHDYPIPHWSYLGRSNARTLTDLAREASGTADRIYRLGPLSYAAEEREPEGDPERVASIGPTLFRILNPDPTVLEQEPEPSSHFVAPEEPVADDAEFDDDTEFVTQRSGPEPRPIEIEPWESWAELKAGYARSYAVGLADLRRNARREWAFYRRRRETGILLDSPYELILLYPDASVELEANRDLDGLVRTERVSRKGLPDVLRIEPLQEPAQELRFVVRIEYPNGRDEEVPFRLPGASQRIQLVTDGGFGVSGARSTAETLDCRANRADDQRLYEPISAGDDDCQTARATALALLVGWADHRACVKDATWRGRWALYREGGNGAPATDVGAPRTPTSGVDSTMTELHEMTGGCDPPALKFRSGMSKYFDRQETGAAFWDLGWTKISSKKLVATAKTVICDEGAPVVIKAPAVSNQWALAWKYSTQTGSPQFLVNQGSGSHRGPAGWIAADTEYCGILCPNCSDCEKYDTSFLGTLFGC